MIFLYLRNSRMDRVGRGWGVGNAHNYHIQCGLNWTTRGPILLLFRFQLEPFPPILLWVSSLPTSSQSAAHKFPGAVSNELSIKSLTIPSQNSTILLDNAKFQQIQEFRQTNKYINTLLFADYQILIQNKKITLQQLNQDM